MNSENEQYIYSSPHGYFYTKYETFFNCFLFYRDNRVILLFKEDLEECCDDPIDRFEPI